MGNKTPTASSSKEAVFKKGEVPPPKITFTEKELRERLTEEEYNITQGKGKGKVRSCLDLWGWEPWSHA